MHPRTAALVTSALGALTAALLLGFAASAGAASPGLDQYVETIPSAGGNHPTEGGNHKGGGNGDHNNGGGSGGGGGSTPGPTLESTQLDALRSQGEAGRRAADALEATSNVGSDGNGENTGSNPTGGGDDRKSPPLDASKADGKAPVEALLSSVLGGGSGILLPIIMVAVLIAGLVIAARTRAGSIGD